MEKLRSLLYVEKYRPATLNDLIFTEKDKLKDYLKNPLTIPSFIFYSSKPGTGKSSCAKAIINSLGCDSLQINSSDERGIDIIREKISQFSRGLSLNTDSKRCVFLDEADGMLSAAQDCLRNLMEAYSENCFFIFSCNSYSKIIEPIRSRCISFNFSKPNRKEILNRLQQIVVEEEIQYLTSELEKLINLYYPDIRSMVMTIQDKKMGGGVEEKLKAFNEALVKLKAKDIEYFRQKIFSQDLDLFSFNNFLFEYFFNNHQALGLKKTGEILLLLADNEKTANLASNLQIVFIANLISIMNIL